MIYSVGHSTRTLEELIEVLTAAGVQELVDVRSVPRSRRNPQFAQEALLESLPASGIAYQHAKALGGFRRPRADSLNLGWEHAGFRGYADYMATREFQAALEWLIDQARANIACIMCAEAQWWRCHRRLIADALIVRGWRVAHLGLGGGPVEHELTPFAVVDGGRLTYPPIQGQLV